MGETPRPHPRPEPNSSPRLVIHCRYGSPTACDLNQRDAQGRTALHWAADALRADEVKLLLESGADPSIPEQPFGDEPIDMLLRRLAGLTSTDSQNIESAREILSLLARHPRTTIRRSLKEDLDTQTERWSVKNPVAITLLKEARDHLRDTPLRAERAPACALRNYEFDSRSIPLRLRSTSN